MKIAIPITDKNNTTYQLNDKFGRCTFFYIYDDKTNSHGFINNKENIKSSHGAGLQTSSLLLNNNVDIVIIKEIGPKAKGLLLENGVNLYSSGTITDISELIKMFQKNKLEKIS